MNISDYFPQNYDRPLEPGKVYLVLLPSYTSNKFNGTSWDNPLNVINASTNNSWLLTGSNYYCYALQFTALIIPISNDCKFKRITSNGSGTVRVYSDK